MTPFGNLKKELIAAKNRHKKRVEQSKEVCEMAFKVSLTEFHQGIKNTIKNPTSVNAINLIKDSVGSSVWIGHSYIRFLNSLVDFSKSDYSHLDNFKHHYIIDHVASKKEITNHLISEEDIFSAIYQDLEYSYANPLYKSTLQFPEIEETIVLVSGVFNELFKTAAFERGAKHLDELHNVKYIVGNVSGVKSSFHNCDQIYEQLKTYVLENPNKKLWLFAYSKGGIDCLHFLAKYKDFSEKHIKGISCIASPILGSGHFDHKILKLSKFIEKYAHSRIYNSEDTDRKNIEAEFHKCFDPDFREEWFASNTTNLSDKLFYTSVALESHWHESHLWMILAKLLFNSDNANDGVVEAELAKYPEYFKGKNLGLIKGHHLISARSSFYSQEALLEAHVIFLNYLGLVGKFTPSVHLEH